MEMNLRNLEEIQKLREKYVSSPEAAIALRERLMEQFTQDKDIYKELVETRTSEEYAIREDMPVSEKKSKLANGKKVSKALEDRVVAEVHQMARAVNSAFESLDPSALALVEHLMNENERLAKYAVTDELTGLPLYKKLEKTAVAREYAREQRALKDGDSKGLSAIFFDVDHFKKFNDTYGHKLGDMVLQYVAIVAKETAKRPGDLVCRNGGEEFVLVLPETDKYGARILAEKLREAIESGYVEGINGDKLKVTASFGVAELQPGQTMSSLIEKADEAMYDAKESGRNRVALYVADLHQDELSDRDFSNEELRLMAAEEPTKKQLDAIKRNPVSYDIGEVMDNLELYI